MCAIEGQKAYNLPSLPWKDRKSLSRCMQRTKPVFLCIVLLRVFKTRNEIVCRYTGSMNKKTLVPFFVESKDGKIEKSGPWANKVLKKNVLISFFIFERWI